MGLTDIGMTEVEKPRGFIKPLDQLKSLTDFEPAKYGLPSWET
jgi:hypothetical protein